MAKLHRHKTKQPQGGLNSQKRTPEFQARDNRETSAPQNATSILAKIIQTGNGYINADLKRWRTAIELAGDPLMPRRAELYELYSKAMEDLHTESEIDVRLKRITGHPYKITTLQGKEVPTKDTPLSGNWFQEVIKYAAESVFWGHSLIEFDIADKKVTEVRLVPREHVVPEHGLILIKPYDRNGLEYRGTLLGRFTVEVGNPESLGKLRAISNHVIRKNGMEKAWLEFGQRFGLPIPYAKNVLSNPTDIEQVDGFLAQISAGQWGRFPHGVEIGFIEASHTDSYEIFMKYIEMKEVAISKSVLGQTMMTNDNGVGSYNKAEVSERVADDILKDDKVLISNFINNTLIPFLKTHGIAVDNLVFDWDNASRLPIMDQWEIDHKLLVLGYSFTPQYLMDTYGAPVLPPVKPTMSANFQQLPFLPAREGAYTPSTKRPTADVTKIIHYNNVTDKSEKALAKAFEAMLRDLHDGKIAKAEIYTAFAAELGVVYNEAIADGYGSIAYGNKDVRVLSFLRKNMFLFSGAKSFEELKELRTLLADENGNRRGWNDFKKAAVAINETHNVNYLRTEYNQAVAASQMASQWVQIKQEQETLPLLEYDAVTDGRTRPEHLALNGIVRPVNDAFWTTYFPPNGWGCRCSVRQREAGEVAVTEVMPDLPSLKPIFKNNVGINGIIFPDDHPYIAEIPKGIWKNISGKMSSAYEMNLFKEVQKNKAGNFVAVHPDHDRTDYPENIEYAKWLMKAGYNVRIRPHSFEQGTKNPEAWVQLPDGEWVLSDFKRHKPQNSTDKGDDFIQKALKRTNQQRANMGVLLLNVPEMTLSNMKKKLRAVFQPGHNSGITEVMLIYPNHNHRVVHLTRESIEDWSFLQSLLTP